jgi:hypothetical protein
MNEISNIQRHIEFPKRTVAIATVEVRAGCMQALMACNDPAAMLAQQVNGE